MMTDSAPTTKDIAEMVDILTSDIKVQTRPQWSVGWFNTTMYRNPGKMEFIIDDIKRAIEELGWLDCQ